jgi:hypothetical protein
MGSSSLKSFLFPLGTASVLTLAMAACKPASLFWMASSRKPTLECWLGSWYWTCSAQASCAGRERIRARSCFDPSKLWCVGTATWILISASHLSFPAYCPSRANQGPLLSFLQPSSSTVFSPLKWFDGRCMGCRCRRFLQVVVYRGVVVSEQCVFMRGS